MENINKTPTTRAMGISIFVSVILFIVVMLAAQMFLPSYFFDSSDYYILVILLEIIPLGIGAWVYLVVSKQKPSDIITFNKPQAKMNKKNMIWLVLIGAGMAFFGRTFLVTLQLGWVELLKAVGFKVSEAVFPAVDTPMVFLWATLGIAVTPAIFEELIFRGILQKGLLRNSKPKTAIIVSSVMFMLMHLSVESMVFTFSCGCILGYMAYKSGSILPSIAFHFVNNFVSVAGLWLLEIVDKYNFDLQAGADLTQIGISEIVVLIMYAVFSLGLLVLALWGFNKIAIAPPKNPYLKPMKPATLVLVVLSGCILFLMLSFFAILQNAYLV